MSIYASINIFGFERSVDSDGYPETIVPQILDVLKQVKIKMKKHKLPRDDAIYLVLRQADFFEGYCNRHDYTYLVNDFKSIFINEKEFSIKKLYKFTEKNYEKLKNRINEEHKDDEPEDN